MPEDSFRPLVDTSKIAEPTDSFRPLLGPRAEGSSPPLPQLDAGHVLNKAVDFIRPFIGNAAGGLAAAGVSLIPGVGETGAAQFAADTQGYAGVDSLLQYLKTKDQRPNSFGEAFGEGEKQALINAVGGRIMNGIFRGGKALSNTIKNADQPEIYKFLPTTSQAAESFGFHSLATATKFAEDFGATGAKAAALDRAGGAGFTQALGFANRINGRQAATNSDPVKLADKIRDTLEQGLFHNSGDPSLHTTSQEALDVLRGGKNPFSKLDEVIQDPDRLAKVLVAGQGIGTNVRKDLQSYQFMRMVNDAVTKDSFGKIRLDPSKLDKVWNDPELKTSFDTLYGKAGRENVSDFFRNIALTQDKERSYPVAKKLWLMSGGVGLGIGALTGNLHMMESAIGGSVGMYIPLGVIGRMLTSEKTAHVITAMAGSEPLSASQTYISRVLTDALQGSSLALLGSDGKKTWGSLEKDPKSGEVKFVASQ